LTAPAVDGGVSEIVACPACGGDLTATIEEWRCLACARSFAVVAEIPDLRLTYDDPYLSRAEDVARARELAARLDDLDLMGLLAEHWRRSGKPPALAERFLAGDRVAAARADAYLDAVERARGRSLGPGDRVLEVGSGTAALAAAAARRTGAAVATDISLRWLVLAKKRLAEQGLSGVALICCNAEEPAFAPGAFSLVLGGDVIEHVADQRRFVAGCARVLTEGGTLFLATPNRLSLGLEPHVRVWGVGWLPRRLAPRYVSAVRHAPYAHVRLLSARALRGLLAGEGLQPHIVAPRIPPATRATYSGLEGRLVDVYNALCSVAAVRRLLLVFGPFFHVTARKGAV
jgi:2-polyprenyl-3-methyl-5-hydroxy-6-metoxy-1,4-benzoquinol methylase